MTRGLLPAAPPQPCSVRTVVAADIRLIQLALAAS